MKTVVMISANAEWRSVKKIFPALVVERGPYGETAALTLKGFNLKLFHSGWGKVASAGAMQYVIDHEQPDLIINLGTCGGFEGVIKQGDVVLVEKTFIYDIVELMGDPDVMEYYASSLDLSWLPDPLPHPAQRGTLASADSDLQPAQTTYLKSLGAIAGDWETGALAWVANKNAARLLILRGVSDLVNEKAGEAYDNLPLFQERTDEVMQILFEQLPDWLQSIKI